MSFPRFDDDGRSTLAFAQEEARTLRHDRIGTEHMLLGLLRLDGGPAVDALDSLHLLLSIAREREGGAAQVLQALGADRTALIGETRRRLGRAQEQPQAAPRPSAALTAWVLPMLVGALLLGAGILIGWAIWG